MTMVVCGRRALVGTVAAGVALLLLIPTATAGAQDVPASSTTAVQPGAADDGAGTLVPTEPIVLEPAVDDGTTTYVPPVDTSALRTLPKLSDIQVTYSGFGPKGQAAIEYAVSIWERMVKSNVPIRMRATSKELPGNALASAGGSWVQDFAGAPRPSTTYPMALADARAGRDLYPGTVDFSASFSNEVEWSTQLDGTFPNGGYDLVSVALHEIGHGLGVSSGMFIENGRGSWGDFPKALDRYLTDGSGATLLTGNNTSGLATRMQSNAVRFSGSQAVAAAGGPVRMYSPSPFDDGSSLSHLDEATYPRGNPDSLMTPQTSAGEAIHDPGNITLGILRDLGWQTTTTRYGKPSAPAFTKVSAGSGRVELTWAKPTSPDRGLIYRYVISQYTGGSSTAAQTFEVPGTKTSLSVTGLTTGTSYRFRIRAENLAGMGADSALSAEARPLKIGPFTDVDAFLNRQYLDILFRGPSASALASRRAAMNTGADTPGETVVALMGDSTHTKAVPPTIRLYLAYFKRLPDPTGLAYWAGKVRAGTSLHKASDQFARSSEFLRTYGSLSNGAFVDLVYQNVLGRNPDSSGRSYWVGKLNNGFARGSMMITVSESGENVRKTANKVAVVGLYHVLLRRIPTTSELDAALARMAGGTSSATLADEILLSSAYYARITGSSPVPVVFEPAVKLPGVEPNRFAAGDLNEDGKQDVVAISTANGGWGEAVAVMLNTGSGLSAPVHKTGGFSYQALLAIDMADVNGDGNLDVVVGGRDGIFYFPGTGTGALGNVVEVSDAEYDDADRAAAAGDVTGDGLDDIIGMGDESQTLSIWRQLPTGGFAAPVTKPFPHGEVPRIELADLNGDTRLDIVALADRYFDGDDWRDGYVAVFLQNSNGTLASVASYGLGDTDWTFLGGMAVADLTGDGALDIAWGYHNQIHVLKNSGTGTFSALAPIATQNSVEDLAAADMDGDGRADLVALWSISQLGVHLQTASGTLGRALVTGLPDGAEHSEMQTVLAIDLNGDTKLDLVTARDYVDPTLWTYLQR